MDQHYLKKHACLRLEDTFERGFIHFDYHHILTSRPVQFEPFMPSHDDLMSHERCKANAERHHPQTTSTSRYVRV